MLRRIFSSILLFLFFLFVTSNTVFAQSASDTTNDTAVAGAATLGVAKMVSVAQKDVKDGSILSNSHQGAVLSTTPYDPQVLGVVARDAAIIVSSTNDPKAIPVIAEGEVYVLVSTQNGQIKKGDFLTTSTIPGVAVKATADGYIIGSAMEDYSNPSPKKIDKIAVSLNLHYFNSKPTLVGTLTDIFKIALLPTKDSPSAIFKYVVAAAVVLGSFTFGFLTFGRTAAKGVEALGRNPAASTIIHIGIIFNVIIVIAIVAAGLGVAFLILRL